MTINCRLKVNLKIRITKKIEMNRSLLFVTFHVSRRYKNDINEELLPQMFEICECRHSPVNIQNTFFFFFQFNARFDDDRLG